MVAADAVLDVDDVVADGEVAEVGDEGGGLGLGARRHRTRGDVGVVREVVCADDDELRVGEADAVGDGGAHDDGRAHVATQVAGFVVDGLGAGVLRARAEAVGEAVLAQHVGESLDFALVGGGDDDAMLLHAERLELLDEGGDRSVEA